MLSPGPAWFLAERVWRAGSHTSIGRNPGLPPFPKASPSAASLPSPTAPGRGHGVPWLPTGTPGFFSWPCPPPCSKFLPPLPPPAPEAEAAPASFLQAFSRQGFPQHPTWCMAEGARMEERCVSGSKAGEQSWGQGPVSWEEASPCRSSSRGASLSHPELALLLHCGAQTCSLLPALLPLGSPALVITFRPCCPGTWAMVPVAEAQATAWLATAQNNSELLPGPHPAPSKPPPENLRARTRWKPKPI